MLASLVDLIAVLGSHTNLVVVRSYMSSRHYSCSRWMIVKGAHFSEAAERLRSGSEIACSTEAGNFHAAGTESLMNEL